MYRHYARLEGDGQGWRTIKRLLVVVIRPAILAAGRQAKRSRASRLRKQTCHASP